jgi:hypothetical protein
VLVRDGITGFINALDLQHGRITVEGWHVVPGNQTRERKEKGQKVVKGQKREKGARRGSMRKARNCGGRGF